MKNLLLFTFVLLFIAGCTNKQQTVEDDSYQSNGYNAFKRGAATNTLIAGKHIDVGTVVIEINDENDFIDVTYETNSDWTIVETHVFVGHAGSDIPVNKPGNPKIGHFPYAEDHDAGTTTFTYSTLPFVTGQQFVVAAHAVVKNNNGQTETAWAYNDVTATKFSGKRWGWFINYQYEDIPLEECTILYGTECRTDSVNIYHINICTEEVILISSEAVPDIPDGSYDGNAWDSETNTFYFTTFPNGDLYSNDMDGEEDSEDEGDLEGEGGSGTFYEGEYYYVDEENELSVVSFDEEGDIDEEEPVDTIDIATTVQDITVGPAGLYIYGIGNGDGASQFFKFELETGTTTLIATIYNEDLQIAFGVDGILYAVDGTDGEYGLYTMDAETGAMTFLFDTSVKFCDLSEGPEI
ncbi:MAG: hypothetical protein DRJ05_11150 [Bacteroidetes bacterium]|nr:MAG: hypothetical protein DRI89_02885 [Bacteroidota bacterium]RLD56544.1 MAG: hypothetical protein DRJ05_11150 [Bacteroidota bacterium]